MLTGRTKKQLILKITNAGVYYNAIEKLNWDQTNFPDKEHFTFSDHLDMFWLVEMNDYSRDTGGLFLEVIQFHKVDSSGFENQSARNIINYLEFIQCNWNALKSCLVHYHAQQFKEKGFDFSDDFEFSVKTLELADHQHFEIYQSFSKIEFKMGYVQTRKSVKGISNNLLIKIENPFIIPEFEYVKSYFSKILETKKIKIYANILDKNDSSTYSFSSPEISRINEELIEGIKQLEIKRKISKTKVISVDKSLFTPEEYFDGIELNLGNNLRKSDRELLSEIIKFQGVKNRKQLEYISGKIQSSDDKLMFTLTPKFGFLFYFFGEEMNHYIWELLDSNATYIWSFDKYSPKNKTMMRITEIINFIREHGRLRYLDNEYNEELIFSKINHEGANSNFVDGFPKWCKKLNEKLV